MFSPSVVSPRLFLATLVCALFLAPVAAQQSRAQRTGQAQTKEDLANNPIWRGSTIGSYFLVFNALLNHDSLDAGRTLDPR